MNKKIVTNIFSLNKLAESLTLNLNKEKPEYIKKVCSCSIALSVFLFTGLSSVSAQVFSPDEQVNIKVYERSNPSIVSIDVDISDGVSSGTGCVIHPSGVILTSSHILEEKGPIKVTLINGKKYLGKIVKITGGKSDLALIKINTGSKLPVISFGDSRKIKVGQKVLTIGNPFGFSRTLTEGIVSRIDYEKNKIQTDAPINPGCSGGPMLNTQGEVIGLCQSIYNPDNNKSNIGIGFAVPINAAKRFIASSQSEIQASLNNNNSYSANNSRRK